MKKLLELEGEFKIKKITYLKVNYIKIILLTFLLTVSIIGLFLLKYFYILSIAVFYSIIPAEEALHIYKIGEED